MGALVFGVHMQKSFGVFVFGNNYCWDFDLAG